MSLSIPKILLVLGAMGAVYYFVFDDETVVPNEAKYQAQSIKPGVSQNTEKWQFRSQSGQYNQTPVYSSTYSDDYGQSSATGRQSGSRLPEPRFRPLDGSSDETKISPTDTRQFQPENRAFSYDSHGSDYPAYRYQGGQTPSNSMLERFRPLDEKRQPKRWQGNYRRMNEWPEQLAAPDRSRSLRLAGPD